MRQKTDQKSHKTFPLEMEGDLHKALKYKAIESDQTLHTFIIETLAAKVREQSAQYVVVGRQGMNLSEKKK